MPYDYAVHSDFLIHWTGKDIDDFYEPKWAESDKSKTDAIPKLNSAYLDRLHSILKYGLWLTEEGETLLQIGDTGVPIPKIPKTCFTELKLSESRTHAKQYGRLGIGVKRPYLFARCGRPLAYYGFRSDAQNDVFMKPSVEWRQIFELLLLLMRERIEIVVSFTIAAISWVNEELFVQ